MTDKLIAVVGLGYVGLPLAVEFGKKRKVIGFDINTNRISELKNGFDSTLETTSEELLNSTYLSYSSTLNDIKNCSIYIIAVPTPIDQNKNPDLTLLKNSSEAVGRVLKKGILLFMNPLYILEQRKRCASQYLKNILD